MSRLEEIKDRWDHIDQYAMTDVRAPHVVSAFLYEDVPWLIARAEVLEGLLLSEVKRQASELQETLGEGA